MKRIGFLLVWFFGLLALLPFAVQSAQGQEVVERLPSGVINWTQGIVTAKGSGIPPTGITIPSQARLMAERAAKADALRNLLEAVKGVRVNAETTVESFTTKSDVVMTRVSGIVIGAQVVDRRYLSDGAVEVTVAVNLTGELLAVMLQELPPITLPAMRLPVLPAVPKPMPPTPLPSPTVPPVKTLPPSPPKETKVEPPLPAKETRVTPPPPPETKATAPTPPAVEEKLDLKKLDYTGLIVDARKLGLRPALIPKVLNEKGELVYSQANVEQRELVQMGLVGYAKDVNAAAKNQRVTAEPVVITGLGATGEKKTDVIISNRDAQVVLTTAPYTGYLKNGRVMLVYD